MALISKELPGGGAAMLLLLLCTLMISMQGASISSFYPRSGPVSGGTMIFISGADFIEAGSSPSRCRFRAETTSSRVSPVNTVSNSTHMTCIMPDVSILFATPPSSAGAYLQMTVTGRNFQLSDSVDFLVFNISAFGISLITPNQTLTNSSSTVVTIYGDNFLNTEEISCYFDSNTLPKVSASFNSSRTLQCLLPAVPTASRQNLVVSLNGQNVGDIQADPNVMAITFYNSPPIATSVHFRPSYSEIILHFDREVEIGPQEMLIVSQPDINPATYSLSLDCWQVLDEESILMIGERASCSWHNTQQRAVVISLTSDSNVTVGSLVRLDNCLVRTRHALFSRLASGEFRVEGTELTPSVILEVPQSIPICGDFVVSGDKSLYGGYRDLAYEWSVGSTFDEYGNVIPDVSWSAIVPSGFSSSGQLRLSFSIIVSANNMGTTSLPNSATQNSNAQNNTTSIPISSASSTESESSAAPLASSNKNAYETGSGYNSSSGNVSGYGSGLEESGSGSSSTAESGSGTAVSNSYTGSGDFESTSENVTEPINMSSSTPGSSSTSTEDMPVTTPTTALRYLFQLRVRNGIFGTVSSVIIGNLSPARVPPLLVLGGHERSETPLSDILLEVKITGEGWSCQEQVHISGYSWTLQSSEAGIVNLEGTRSNLSALLLPPCALQPGSQYRAELTVFLTGQSSASTSTLICVEESLQARLAGGVRRSIGTGEALTLSGEASIIELHPSTRLFVVWNCSIVAVPEITGSPSCQNFDESGNLTVAMPVGTLAPGGYRFTLHLFAMASNGTDLESSSSQVTVIFPVSIPRVQIEVKRESRFQSVLVHESLTLVASILSFRPAMVQWTVEYVEGKSLISYT